MSRFGFLILTLFAFGMAGALVPLLFRGRHDPTHGWATLVGLNVLVICVSAIFMLRIVVMLRDAGSLVMGWRRVWLDVLLFAAMLGLAGWVVRLDIQTLHALV